jgi:queuosine precursor transporter
LETTTNNLPENQKEHKKKTALFIVLSAIFLTNAIVAELIGVKIFSIEALLNLPPAQLKLFGGFALDFNLTAGVVIWPVVFITTDIINEYFGQSGVKRLSTLAAVMISYVFVAVYFVTTLPAAEFWMQINSKMPDGSSFDIDYAFSKIFLQGLGIIIGSIVAFLISQFLDVYVFHYLRRFTGHRKIWLRATGSTLVSQLIDSFVVLAIAFNIFGQWSLQQVVSVGIINYIYKSFVAVVLTPLLYVAHGIIDSYLGKELSDEMIDDASEASKKFM